MAEEKPWTVEQMPIHGWAIMDASGHQIVKDIYDEDVAREIVCAVNCFRSLSDALLEAKALIKIWHGDVAWDVYDVHSPEMLRINRALYLAEKGSE